MARADILNIMYSREMSPLEFRFETLTMPSMYNYLTIQDINQLRYIATSNKYAAKIDLKYKAIDDIMVRRGFRKFHCGTNRIVYKFLEDETFLVKIALDKVGMGDNPKEYKNQFLLKPFVTKMFQMSPCGTVAFVERVQPVTSRQEFSSIANEVFELLSNCIIGKYVLEDVGTKYFMNYGLRNGFGPVLLDYPYVFELDGNKLYCNKVYPNGFRCDGEIDYDAGFNNLVCTKCGKIYLAQELEASIKDKLIIMKDEGELNMKIQIKRGNNVLIDHDTSKESRTINRTAKTVKAPRVNVSLGEKLLTKREEKREFNGNKSTKEYKKDINNNKEKDHNKGKGSYNNNKYQNRKSNKGNSRFDKFKDYNKTEKPKEEVINEKITEYKEKPSIDNSKFIESLKEEQKILDIKKEIGTDGSEEVEVKETDEDIYKAYGISEEDFNEPTEVEEEKELNKDILNQY